MDSSALEKLIIGCYSREVQPRSPADKGFTAFIRLLYGITDTLRTAKVAQILSVAPGDIMRVSGTMLEQWDQSRQCVLAGKKMLNDDKNTSFTGIVHRYTL